MEPKIGIYWYFENKLIVYAEDVSSVKPVEGFLDVDISHYEFWGSVKEKDPSKRRFEYEDIPRGRIVMDIKKEKSKTIMIMCMLENSYFCSLDSW